MVSRLIGHNGLLILRPVQPNDYAQIFKWENDPLNWIQSGISEPYSKSDIETFVAQPQDLFLDGQMRYMIDLKNGETVGCVDLFDYNAQTSISSLGIIIDQSFRNNGYALEALNILIIGVEKYSKIKTLKALVLKYNKASVALFKKAGFNMVPQEKTSYFHQNIEYTQLTYLKKI